MIAPALTLITTLSAALALAANPAPARASGKPGFTIKPGRYRAIARFTVSYAGAGNWHTTYHSDPPSDPANPSGPHDTNQATDSSTQVWTLRFGRQLVLPVCGTTRRQRACPTLERLTAASGRESATGSIAHAHQDGLFPADDGSLSCRLVVSVPATFPHAAEVQLRYLPSRRALALTALAPVTEALNLLPGACPQQGDGTDGLYDNYFTPGFSFASGYGTQRWYTSPTVLVPTRILHRAAVVKILLRDTAAGTPPRSCAVAHPSLERCVTGGSWSGTLTLTAA